MSKLRKMIRVSGFTLVEIMVAVALSVIVIGGVTTAFVQAMMTWQIEQVKGELNDDLELSMEMIRQDMRLSSVGVGLMAFYPTNSSTYSAISFPLSADSNGDGRLDRDADMNLIWNQTVIYHIRPGSPDKLLRTTYSPRYTNETPALIYEQLAKVVASTTMTDLATACMPGESVSSRTIFENLVDLDFIPPTAVFDGYHETELKTSSYTFGSLVMGSGYHNLIFTVTGKNVASTGYKMVIDKVSLSNSQSERDAELCYPVNQHPVSPYYSVSGVGGTFSTEYRGGSWIGGAVLVFDPSSSTGLGATVTFPIYNDLWCDNNFDTPAPTISSNCSIKVATNFTPADIVVSMDKGTCWTASSCGEKAPGATPFTFAGVQSTVTNIIYGGTNNSGMTITRDGCWAKLYFERMTNYSLLITNCQIFHQASGTSNNVTFNNGQAYCYLNVDDLHTSTNSDWIQGWEIFKASNYLVRFTVLPSGDQDYDMFIGEETTPSINFFRNSGTTNVPAFHGPGSPINNWPSGSAITAGGAIAPTFGDVDGDGDYDLLIGIIGQGFRMYANEGTTKSCSFPTATAVASLTGSANPTPILKDFYGADGLLDVVSGYQSSGGFAFFRNTGSINSPVWTSVGVSIIGMYTGVSASDGGGGLGSPDLVDIDGDGLLDLFSGCRNGVIYHWKNTGTLPVPVFTYVTNMYNNISIAAGTTAPRFVDIDGDGTQDMLVGDADGNCTYFHNSGTKNIAAWDAGVVVETVAGRAVPAFVNIDGERSGAAYWSSTNVVVLSYKSGVAGARVIGLSSIETGYPKAAVMRSGIFDTRDVNASYSKLNWTSLQNYPQGQVTVRVRASDYFDMSDMTELDWRDATAANSGYFQNNEDNDLATLPRRRYLQYEALLKCNADGTVPWAHTNSAQVFLRDVTINWPGDTGLVDLQADFGKAPDNGVISATVDGNTFVNGLQVRMSIYKAARVGTNTVSGVMQIRPLNTGR